MTTTEIAALPVFSAVPRAHRIEVAQRTDRVSVPAGRILTRQGSVAHEFFVIVDGVVDVIRDGRVVARLGPGDFFGEIALVGDPHRTATVVAASNLDVAVLTRREFRTLLARFPEFASTVLSTASRRVVASLREVEGAVST
jgi:CRP/FNR family cyclic AMP-dependent transcriptional regulator